MLAGEAWEDAVAAALGRAFANARRSLPDGDVVGGGVVLCPPEVAGPDLLPHQVAALRALLERAIRRAAQWQRLPIAAAAEPAAAKHPASSRTGRAQAKTTKPAEDDGAAHRIRKKVAFRLTSRQFFEIRKRFARRDGSGTPDPAEPMDLYFAQLDEVVSAAVWLVEARRKYDFSVLSKEVTAAYAVTRKSSEYV